MTKKIVVQCHGNKRIVFCDTTFCLNKLATYEPPYMATPNCLWTGAEPDIFIWGGHWRGQFCNKGSFNVFFKPGIGILSFLPPSKVSGRKYRFFPRTRWRKMTASKTKSRIFCLWIFQPWILLKPSKLKTSCSRVIADATHTTLRVRCQFRLFR